MLATRVIARLDIKPSLGVVKGIRFEGLRVIGDPRALAAKYAAAGADELLYLDLTASLYGRNALVDLVRWTAGGEVWIPLTVGGGVRSAQDVRALLRAGADKVALNTAALARPALIRECAERFGSQAIVVEVQAKRVPGALGASRTDDLGGGRYLPIGPQRWEAYGLGGREPSGREAREWAREAAGRGAGEILLTSIDRDGTGQGFDLELLAALALDVPLIASGGCRGPADAQAALRLGADAVAIGTWLHRGGDLGALKSALAQEGVHVRRD